jgi:septal ring factor EnvC (AmiA/AmiB activator)
LEEMEKNAKKKIRDAEIYLKQEQAKFNEQEAARHTEIKQLKKEIKQIEAEEKAIDKQIDDTKKQKEVRFSACACEYGPLSLTLASLIRNCSPCRNSWTGWTRSPASSVV